MIKWVFDEQIRWACTQKHFNLNLNDTFVSACVLATNYTLKIACATGTELIKYGCFLADTVVDGLVDVTIAQL